MDARFGKGQWRPLERFLIVQPDGKERVIDNARRTLHNSSTAMPETIYTVHLDFIPAVIKQLAQRLQVVDPAEWAESHPWAHFRLGTDDLPDAYRGLPVCDDHVPFSAVAIWVPICLVYDRLKVTGVKYWSLCPAPTEYVERLDTW